jgi:hypothetical protein
MNHCPACAASVNQVRHSMNASPFRPIKCNSCQSTLYQTHFWFDIIQVLFDIIAALAAYALSFYLPHRMLSVLVFAALVLMIRFVFKKINYKTKLVPLTMRTRIFAWLFFSAFFAGVSVLYFMLLSQWW